MLRQFHSQQHLRHQVDGWAAILGRDTETVQAHLLDLRGQARMVLRVERIRVGIEPGFEREDLLLDKPARGLHQQTLFVAEFEFHLFRMQPAKTRRRRAVIAGQFSPVGPVNHQQLLITGHVLRVDLAAKAVLSAPRGKFSLQLAAKTKQRPAARVADEDGLTRGILNFVHAHVPAQPGDVVRGQRRPGFVHPHGHVAVETFHRIIGRVRMSADAGVRAPRNASLGIHPACDFQNIVLL
jgi:hypothetical protein